MSFRQDGGIKTKPIYQPVATKMKQFIKFICIGLVCSIGIFLFYFNTNYYIHKQYWKANYYVRKQNEKANYGTFMGDFIIFDDKLYRLEGRRIYKNGKPVANVVFCWGFNLTIKEEITDVTRTYTNKTW
jgi:hypothetical protein